MLIRYKRGESVIWTTEARYNATFKSMGYVPYIEKPAVKKADKEVNKTKEDK